jgi:hypothetical protein
VFLTVNPASLRGGGRQGGEEAMQGKTGINRKKASRPRRKLMALIIIAALSAALLGLAAPAPADAASAVEYGVVYGTIAPSNGVILTNVYVIIGLHDYYGNPRVIVYKIDQNIDNNNSPYYYSVPLGLFEAGNPTSLDQYTIMGLYEDAQGHTGVTVALKPTIADQAINTPWTWDYTFPLSLFGYNETTVAGYLTNGNEPGLIDFFSKNIPSQYFAGLDLNSTTASPSTLVNFSTAKYGGTAQAVLGSTTNVSIDIKPGSAINSINPDSMGKIAVAIWSTPVFNAPLMVEQNSLKFGETGNEVSLAFCTVEDVDGDGLPDLVAHFYTQATGFQSADTQGNLSGFTKTGIPISGSDAVRLAPAK